MFKIENLDDSTSFMAQLQEKTGPIVLINTFLVPAGTVEQVMKSWQEDSSFMKVQPGFISAQLHRGIASSRLLVNVSVWETSEALKDAFSSPEFQDKAKRYPDGIVVFPHIFQKVAIDGVCVA